MVVDNGKVFSHHPVDPYKISSGNPVAHPGQHSHRLLRAVLKIDNWDG